MNFIVLSSSRGTIFQAVIDHVNDGSLHPTCLGLVSDNPNRGAAMKAKAADIPVVIVQRKQDEPRDEYDMRLHQAFLDLGATEATTICCLGWMMILSPGLVSLWRNRILNVHPSLLPKYPGTRAHESVLASGDKESGMTIHLIDEGLDTGTPILQKTCPVLPGDTMETLKARVQALECEWFPRALEMIDLGEIKLPT